MWRFDDSLLEVPADATVIDQQAIERSGTTDVAEILRKEANVFFRSFNGKANDAELSMRGFGENSGLRVLVLLDGQRFNRPDLGGLNWQQIPASEIERIEVIRGGQTVLYGDQALAGVVKITTKKGGPKRARAQVIRGNYDLWHASAEGRGEYADIYYSAGFNYDWDRGYRSNSLTVARSPSASLGYRLPNGGDVTFRGNYSDSLTELPGPLSFEQFLDNPRQSINGGEDEIEQDSARFGVDFNSPTPLGDATLQTGYSYRDRRSTLNDSDNTLETVNFSPMHRFTFEWGFIQAGVDTRYDAIDHTGYRADRIRPEDAFTYAESQADFSRWTVGPYVFAKVAVLPRLSISGGVRYELALTDAKNDVFVSDQVYAFRPIPRTNPVQFEPNPNFSENPDVNEGASFEDGQFVYGVAGEVGLNYRLRPEASVWLRFNQVYHYPVLDELGAYQGFVLDPPFNTGLDPETGQNVELGVHYRGEWMSASATVFGLWLEDEIGFISDGGSGTGLNINLPDTRRVGGNIELALNFGNYGASTRWEGVDARFVAGEFSGNRIPLVPTITGVSQFWVEFFPDVRTSIALLYTGDQAHGSDFSNERFRSLEDYLLVDLSLHARLNKHLTIFGAIRNALNQQYVSQAFSGGYYSGAGRRFTGGLRLDI